MDAVLIAGFGYIGAALAKQLDDAGTHQVFGLRRRPIASSPNIKMITADLTKPFELPELKDYKRLNVIFAASAGTHTPEAYEQVYIQGLQNLITALKHLPQKPRRLLFISSTSVYGDTGGEVVTEQTEAVPDGFAGKIMLKAEALLKNCDIESVALRFGGIYGPGRWRLAEQVKSGEAKFLPAGGPISNRIHCDDGAAAILHVMNLEKPAPVYLVVDNEPTKHNDIISWLAKQCGRDVTTKAVPGGSDESVVARQLRGNKSCSNALLKSSGFRYRYPSFREGFAAFFES